MVSIRTWLVGCLLGLLAVAVAADGLVALAAGDHAGAISAFNSVYGQLPGELAPKLALARACELGGEAEIAAQMYAQCAKTDAAYVAPAQFGLARLAATAGRSAPDENTACSWA